MIHPSGASVCAELSRGRRADSRAPSIGWREKELQPRSCNGGHIFKVIGEMRGWKQNYIQIHICMPNCLKSVMKKQFEISQHPYFITHRIASRPIPEATPLTWEPQYP